MTRYSPRVEKVAVLIVDDEPSVGRLMSRLLKRLNVSHHVVETGSAALEYLSSHEVSLILLDGKLGVERADIYVPALRTRAPTARIVGISGANLTEGGSDGVYDGFALKPALPDEMRALMDRWLPAPRLS